MSIAKPLPASRVPPGLGTRLLHELRKDTDNASFLKTLPAEGDSGEIISGDQFAALYRAAIERMSSKVAKGNGHLSMTKQELDLLVRCVSTCATLEDAILCAADFCAMLYPRASILSLERHAENAVFIMDTVGSHNHSAECLVNLTGLFCFVQMFGWLIGQPLQPSRVFLSHQKREDAIPFLGIFSAPVSFGKPACGFEFNADLLARPLLRQSVELEPFLRDLPFGLVGKMSAVVSTASNVRNFLSAVLTRGLPVPTLPAIAASMGYSATTLQRYLRAENSSYKVVKNQCLREAAEYYLSSTDWPIERIAENLDFGSAAAFRRAFADWTGHSPTGFRRQAHDQALAGRDQRVSA